MRAQSFLRRKNNENGQAMVEFALILFPLLILVVGIIQFGIGLNYWLDMNRLSNQGARWAVVNGYPGCGVPSTPTTRTPWPCGSTTTLAALHACQPCPELSATVTSRFRRKRGPWATHEDQLSSPYLIRFVMNLGTINLAARRPMRLEQRAVRFQAGAFTPTTCP